MLLEHEAEPFFHPLCYVCEVFQQNNEKKYQYKNSIRDMDLLLSLNMIMWFVDLLLLRENMEEGLMLWASFNGQTG